MDPGALPTHLWAVALGWFARVLTERPQDDRPCQCHCRCACVSEGGPSSWIALLVLLALCIGGGIWIWYSKKDIQPAGSPKGRKGTWGV